MARFSGIMDPASSWSRIMRRRMMAARHSLTQKRGAGSATASSQACLMLITSIEAKAAFTRERRKALRSDVKSEIELSFLIILF